MVENYNDLLESGGFAEFASDEPRHYDRVPSVIDHLTYVDEEVDESGVITYYRKRLTPIEKELYRVLRYRAGSNACWRNVEDLASHVGCGKNTITQAKRVLAMPFEQLEGNPLIFVEERMVKTVRDDVTINKRPVHIITIFNIWRHNNAFMDMYDHKESQFPERKERIEKCEAEIIIERMSQPGKVETVHNLGGHHQKGRSRGPHHKRGTSSPESSSLKRDVNKDNITKDHCSGTKTKAEALARCFLEDENVYECFDSQHDALVSLQKFGLTADVSRKLVGKHSPGQILSAVVHLIERRKKKPVRKTILGYFLQILENKWYEPNLV